MTALVTKKIVLIIDCPYSGAPLRSKCSNWFPTLLPDHQERRSVTYTNMQACIQTHVTSIGGGLHACVQHVCTSLIAYIACRMRSDLRCLYNINLIMVHNILYTHGHDTVASSADNLQNAQAHVLNIVLHFVMRRSTQYMCSNQSGPLTQLARCKWHASYTHAGMNVTLAAHLQDAWANTLHSVLHCVISCAVQYVRNVQSRPLT